MIERYLVFPGDGHHIRTHNGCRDTPDGIATISWILFPFYYAPVLVFTVLVAVYATLAIRYIHRGFYKLLHLYPFVSMYGLIFIHVIPISMSPFY